MHTDAVRGEEANARSENGSTESTRDRKDKALLEHALIAVIDDDDDTRETVCRRLQRAGYQVQAFDDAARALVEMEKRPPALIVLDLMMPGMDGWQFRIEQRNRPALSEIPVVVTSGDASRYAAAIDAAAYFMKPIDFDRLRNVVDQVLLTRERSRLAAKAVELERVRLLGMLVAGMAHEINNPLTYMLANLAVASRVADVSEEVQPGRGDDDPEKKERERRMLKRALSAATEGAERIAFVVQLLSTFGRSDTRHLAPVDPLRPLDAAIRLAAHHIEARARLATEFTSCPYVFANESKLAQVFLNLLVNASQAIPEGDREGNQITVRAFSEGQRCVIEVSDTGVGIAPEFRARIFDSFFTTKPAGTGIGLGLSIARDIVQSFGGTISVESEEGVGSTFRVELPAGVTANAQASEGER